MLRRYELNGELYTWNEVADIVEKHQLNRRLLSKICKTFCVAHAVDGVLLILFIDKLDNWPGVLLGIIWCAFAAVLFGAICNSK